MKIAIFTDFYLPSLGGTQTSIANQKLALEQAGHTVYIFTAAKNQKPYRPHDGIIGLPVLPLVKVDGHAASFPWPWIIAKTTKLVKDLAIDAVHVQTEFTVGNMGIKIARSLDLPVLCTFHTLMWKQIDANFPMPRVMTASSLMSAQIYWGELVPKLPFLPGETAASNGWRRLVAAMSSRVDRVIAPSDHLAEKLRLWGITTPISVIPNPVSLKETELKVLPEVPEFVWLGRFSPEKRPIECVRAVLLAEQRTDKPFKVSFYGAGPLFEAAKLQARGSAAIEFKGRLDYKDVPAVYMNASALLLTSSDFDNQPMVIGEALSYGRGVVYCDPNLREGLDSGAGYLTGPDPESMAEGIQKLVDKPARLNDMSQAAIKARNIFSPSQFAAKATEVYERLAKAR